ncbi:SID1 transmembrane member [Halocaridina rubra]|uniref:SID1 transmembrane member n=1 Tax=Halocaridina rubra TaxID=373956 RepID=A0AAN8XKH7_HALRR
MIQVWKGWRPVVNKLSGMFDEGSTSTLLHIVRIFTGVAANFSLLLYGAIADPNVYRYILVICLLNLGLYFGNYILTKRIHFKEKGTRFAWACLLLSVICWILALVAFNHHSTDAETSASDSRAMNSSCVFFGVFDAHDAWHIMSSMGLFTFFIGLLTLDDDLYLVPSKRIHVF